MTLQAPEVSVVVPTRNRAGYLRDALDTALNQVGVAIEVIVVDDASTDETPSLLAKIEDPRLRTLRLDRSRGMSAARNAAIEVARGAWVAFLDDDDLWAPDKLRRQLDAARQTGSTWVFCDILVISPDNDIIPVVVPRDTERMLELLLEHNVVQAGNSTVLVQTEILRRVGAYDDGLNSPWDLWIRLAASGPPAVVDDALVAYRRHAATFVSRNRRTALREADLLSRKHRALSEQYGIAFDFDSLDRWLRSERVRALRRTASASLADGRPLAAARAQLGAFIRTRHLADLRPMLGIVAGRRVRNALRRVQPREATSGRHDTAPDWLVPFVACRAEERA